LFLLPGRFGENPRAFSGRCIEEENLGPEILIPRSDTRVSISLKSTDNHKLVLLDFTMVRI